MTADSAAADKRLEPGDVITGSREKGRDRSGGYFREYEGRGEGREELGAAARLKKAQANRDAIYCAEAEKYQGSGQKLYRPIDECCEDDGPSPKKHGAPL